MPKKKTTVKKKTVKKVVRKKITTKRITLKKSRGKKMLVLAPPEQCFLVWNGPVLSNLWELQEALKKDISDIQFEYHCANGKCDFALWINDILCDKACAKSFAKAKTRKGAVAAVKKCLKTYK